MNVPLSYVVIGSILGALSFLTNLVATYEMVSLKSELRVLRSILAQLGVMPPTTPASPVPTFDIGAALKHPLNWQAALAHGIAAAAAAAASSAPSSPAKPSPAEVKLP